MRHDVPLGEDRWLTVVSPADPEGTQILLEPAALPAAVTFCKALYDDGIPFTQLAVDDLQEEYDRLAALDVEFTMTPTDMGTVSVAVLDDTCGNLIQLAQMK